MIRLDTSIQSDLKWEGVKKGTDWFLDFGFNDKLPLFDQKTPFSSYAIAIDEFLNRFCDDECEELNKVYLFRGTLKHACSMVWSLGFEEDFESWKGEHPLTDNLRDFYAIQVFSEYLHRLAAALPDRFEAYVHFQVSSDDSPSLIAQMTSLEHFPYIKVEVEGHPYFSPEREELATVGVVFPPLAFAEEQAFVDIDALLEGLNDLDLLFRLVPESHLTEEWCGLDDLILFSNYLSPQGERKARGFVAAGGQLVWVGKVQGLDREVSVERFLKSRGRGI